MNEGTNDVAANTAAVPGALGTVLTGLLAAAPGAPIAVLRPFGGNQQAALQAGLAPFAATGLVSYVDTTGILVPAYGIDSANRHPSAANDQAIIAAQVAEPLRPRLYPPRLLPFLSGFH